jgi:hypothetical protein
MKVIDPGHSFELDCLDNRPGPSLRLLRFVKREGPKYPGNVGSYPGTTTQEVLRALISRTLYVDGQEPSEVNKHVLLCMRRALYLLEERAAMRAGRALPEDFLHSIEPERFPTCTFCGHVGCLGDVTAKLGIPPACRARSDERIGVVCCPDPVCVRCGNIVVRDRDVCLNCGVDLTRKGEGEPGG